MRGVVWAGGSAGKSRAEEGGKRGGGAKMEDDGRGRGAGRWGWEW